MVVMAQPHKHKSLFLFNLYSVLRMKGAKKGMCSFLELILQPAKVPQGIQKLRANVRNKSDTVVRNIILTMHSMNEKAISVRRGEKFIYALMPGQEVSADFDILADSDAHVYFSLSGFKNADMFFRTNSTTQKILVNNSAANVILN